MFEIIWTFAIASVKAVGLAMAAYIFYWRVFDYFRAVHFYKSQGDHVCKINWGHLPIFGNAIMIAWSAWKSWKDQDNYFIMKHAFDYGTKTMGAENMIGFITKEAGIATCDVKVVEHMYTTKNKYFDKHPLTKDLSHCLTGESILFAETSDDWRKSRKAISPAFYKGKLENLIEIAKEAVDTTLKHFKSIASKGPKSEVDIMEEIGMMTARILLKCAFGVDCSDEPV